ncbi:MAG: hypothetical protein IPJ22_13605 [Bacteroidetes bacterium]|nr:hypothetical protein [Bacteroidota bacterium]
MASNFVLYNKKPFKYYLAVTLGSIYFLLFGSNTLSVVALFIPPIVFIFAAYLVVLVLLGIVYYMDRIVNKKSLTKIDLIVIIMCLVPIYPAIMANQVFGQSILKGLITVEKANIGLLSCCGIYYLIRNNILRVEEYYKSILFLCWASLALYVYMIFTMNPAAYQDTAFVGFNPSKGGWVFRFSTAPLAFGITFYFLEYIFYNKKSSLILFAALFSYLLFIDKSRITIFANVGVIGLYMFYALPFLKAFGKMLYLLFFGAIIIYGVYLYDPAMVEILTGMMTNFFLALIGIDTGEGSVDTRWIEMAKVWKFFDEHPGVIALGAGQLNKDGMEYFLSGVYLSDIGIVGILLVYGIVGTALQYLYFGLSAYWAWGNKTFKNEFYFHVTKIGLLSIFVDSFFTGGFVWFPSIFVNSLLVLQYYRIEDQKARQQAAIINN